MRAAQSFFGFGQSAEIFIKLNDGEGRKKVEAKTDTDEKQKLSVYYDGESVSGQVSAARNAKSRQNHNYCLPALAPARNAVITDNLSCINFYSRCR